jgi:hypothetical protein
LLSWVTKRSGAQSFDERSWSGGYGNVTVVDTLQHCCYEFPREEEHKVMIAEVDQVDIENVIKVDTQHHCWLIN